MTREGVAVVAAQEFRLRIRAGRWKALLVVWTLLLAAFTALLRGAAGAVDGLDDDGVVVYGGLALVVLGLGLLVAPSLAAQSVNGDRDRGTLAALQVTRLSAGEIALGKFAAAWGTSLVFLALTLPLAAYAATQGGVPLLRLVVVTGVLGLLLGSVCALALWLSSALLRTTTSGLVAYLLVAVLTIGTLVAWGLATAVTTESYDITYASVDCPGGYPEGPVDPQDPPAGCTSVPQTYRTSRARPDRTWWLLAPNPFVVLADAAPGLAPVDPLLPPRERDAAEQARSLDPLGQLGGQVRGLRDTPVPVGELQRQAGDATGAPLVYDDGTAPPHPRRVWPWGLAFDVALGAGALVLTARRLRTPTRRLAQGQRVA